MDLIEGMWVIHNLKMEISSKTIHNDVSVTLLQYTRTGRASIYGE